MGEALHVISELSSSKGIYYTIVIFTMMPQLICMFVVIIWYVYMLVKESMRILSSIDPWTVTVFEHPPNNNNLNYVKTLLKGTSIQSIVHNYDSLWQSISSGGKRSSSMMDLYHKISLPLPILLATAISSVVLLQLTVFSSTIVVPLFSAFFGIGESGTIKHILNYAKAAMVLSSLLATTVIVILFGHLLFVIRKEIILIRRGDSKFTEDIHRVSWPAMKLTSYVRYIGTQVASILTGWIFYQIAFLIFFVFFGLVIFMPKVGGFLLYFIFMSVLFTILILVVQTLMCHFFFLTSESAQHWTIVLDNRRVFDYFTYIGLLYSIATGLYTNLLRVLMSFSCTLLIMPRLDMLVFVKPFTRLDTGYSSYRSFMIVEALLNNPVVHVFADLLLAMNKERKFNNGYSIYTQVKTSSFRVSRKARNRWFVAYTLLNNPTLRRNFEKQYGTSSNGIKEKQQQQQKQGSSYFSFNGSSTRYQSTSSTTCASLNPVFDET